MPMRKMFQGRKQEYERSFNMDTERMQDFCKWLKITKDNGIDIALECGFFTGSTFFGHEIIDPERDPQKFAEGYYQVLKYLILEKGFTNIKYLSLFVEPTTNERRAIPDGFPDVWSYYVVVVKTIHERLIRGGIRDKVKLVGPNNSERGRLIANAVADLSDEIQTAVTEQSIAIPLNLGAMINSIVRKMNR